MRLLKMTNILTVMLAALLLSSLLTAALLLQHSAAANDSSQLTATSLLALYKSARSDITNTFEIYLNASSGSNIAHSATLSETTSNETTSPPAIESSSINMTEMNGTLPPCANINETISEYLKQADQYAEAAEANIRAGNYNIAAHQALKALNILGKAYVHLTHCIETEMKGIGNISTNTSVISESEGENNEAKYGEMYAGAGLMSAILRHEIRLSRLKAVLQAASNSGMNVSSSWELLSQAEDLLSKARSLALEGNSSEAARTMAEANKLMAQIVRNLKAGSIKAIEHGKWLIKEKEKEEEEKEKEGNRNITAAVINVTKAHHGQNHSRNGPRKANNTSEGKAEHESKKPRGPPFTTNNGRENHENRNENRSRWGREHERTHGNISETESNEEETSSPS